MSRGIQFFVNQLTGGRPMGVCRPDNPDAPRNVAGSGRGSETHEWPPMFRRFRASFPSEGILNRDTPSMTAVQRSAMTSRKGGAGSAATMTG